MNIRLAKEQDLPRIMEMVKISIMIMKSENSDQWTEEYPLTKDFEKDLNEGSLYVADLNGEVVGAITVDQIQPEEYLEADWRRKDEPFFVFHRLVVDSEIRGAGIASQLISHAENLSIYNRVYYMKTDTYSLNPNAQRLFEKNGYQRVDTIFLMGKNSPFYCYDKILNH
ncbi:GNAT family N-acetyltransferase [Mesobacillus harenae]|uniref:GNAT family N-acetyltransferase n=1 Tax=Mesobacillus harenae TaxID=2213203 RepID=UPI001580A327